MRRIYDTIESVFNNVGIFHFVLRKFKAWGKYIIVLWYDFVRCLRFLVKIHVHSASG